jgi:hypothetical protein
VCGIGPRFLVDSDPSEVGLESVDELLMPVNLTGPATLGSSRSFSAMARPYARLRRWSRVNLSSRVVLVMRQG